MLDRSDAAEPAGLSEEILKECRDAASGGFHRRSLRAGGPSRRALALPGHDLSDLFEARHFLEELAAGLGDRAEEALVFMAEAAAAFLSAAHIIRQSDPPDLTDERRHLQLIQILVAEALPDPASHLPELLDLAYAAGISERDDLREQLDGATLGVVQQRRVPARAGRFSCRVVRTRCAMRRSTGLVRKSSAPVDPADAGAAVFERGDHHEQHRGGVDPLEPPTDLEAVHARHHDAQEHQIGLMGQALDQASGPEVAMSSSRPRGWSSPSSVRRGWIRHRR